MSSVHRKLDGSWAECADAACQLKFHIPNMSAATAEALPMGMLLLLMEAVDPPTSTSGGGHFWLIRNPNVEGVMSFHREYDLPAVIWANGSMEWFVDDMKHREGDKPAVINADGTQEWWHEGELHRDGGKPAVIRADGKVQYWVHGDATDPSGRPLDYV